MRNILIGLVIGCLLCIGPTQADYEGTQTAAILQLKSDLDGLTNLVNSLSNSITVLQARVDRLERRRHRQALKGLTKSENKDSTNKDTLVKP